MTVLVRDMTREQRWPAYQPRALARGVGSSLSLPLTTGDTSFGALNIYSSS